MTIAEATQRETNEACIRRVWEKISTRQFSDLAIEVTEDLVFELPYGPKGMTHFTGRDRWDRMQLATFEAFSRFTLTEVSMYPSVDPNVIIAEYKSEAQVASSNKEYRNTYIGVFTFRDGQIAAWREYTDPRVINDAFSVKDQVGVAMRWGKSELKGLIAKLRKR